MLGEFLEDRNNEVQGERQFIAPWGCPAHTLSSREQNRSANTYNLVIIAGALRLNYALGTREPIPRQRTTGLYCRSWHYPTERMRTIILSPFPIPLHKPRIKKRNPIDTSFFKSLGQPKNSPTSHSVVSRHLQSPQPRSSVSLAPDR